MKIRVRENWDGMTPNDDDINIEATQTAYIYLLTAEIKKRYPDAEIDVTFDELSLRVVDVDDDDMGDIAADVQNAREMVYDTHAYWVDE